MRIGIDARLYRASAAGIGRYSQNIIKNLLEIDHENEYVLFMNEEDRKDFENSNIQNSSKIGNSKFEIITTNISHYSVAEQTQFLKILNRANLDLMHFINFNHPVRYRRPFVVTIHDLTLFYYPGRSKRSLIYKQAYKYVFANACAKAKHIIAVSNSTKNDIKKVFKTAEEKISVIYEAADDKTFETPTEESLAKIKLQYAISDMPVLLYVGQWRPHKNLVGLVKAFSKLRKQMPCKLAFVGKVDHAYPEVFETIDKERILSDIIMPGFVNENELAAWYKISSVFVYPSFYEGFGLPGLEAMMAGTPVVASNKTSLPEIYKEAALYFDPFNIDEMTDTIKKVIEDKSLRLQLIEEGKRISSQYSWKKAAEETLKVYKNIK